MFIFLEGREENKRERERERVEIKPTFPACNQLLYKHKAILYNIQNQLRSKR